MTNTNTEAVEAAYREGYYDADNSYSLAYNWEWSDARDALSTAKTEPSAAGLEEDEVRRLLRAVYDDLPHKAISPALSKATGVPLGEVIPFDTAIACGWDFCGYERTIRAILTALSAPTRERELLREARKEIGSFAIDPDPGGHRRAVLISPHRRPTQRRIRP